MKSAGGNTTNIRRAKKGIRTTIRKKEKWEHEEKE